MAGLQDTTPPSVLKTTESVLLLSLCLCNHPPPISTTCHTTSELQVCFLTTLADHHPPDTSDLGKQGTDHSQTKMKTSLFVLLVLMFCFLCRAQKHGGDHDISLQVVKSGEERARTQTPGTEAEGGEQEIVPSDIWAELRNLRDMVVEQRVELRHLTARVTAAESLAEALQEENTGTL